MKLEAFIRKRNEYMLETLKMGTVERVSSFIFYTYIFAKLRKFLLKEIQKNGIPLKLNPRN